jgi:hypothetical protein
LNYPDIRHEDFWDRINCPQLKKKYTQSDKEKKSKIKLGSMVKMLVIEKKEEEVKKHSICRIKKEMISKMTWDIKKVYAADFRATVEHAARQSTI